MSGPRSEQDKAISSLTGNQRMIYCYGVELGIDALESFNLAKTVSEDAQPIERLTSEIYLRPEVRLFRDAQRQAFLQITGTASTSKERP